MSILRTKETLRSFAVFLPVLLLALPSANAAEGQKEKLKKPTETRQSTQPKTTPQAAGKPDRNFTPREKVSAGKPVSFPTDI